MMSWWSFSVAIPTFLDRLDNYHSLQDIDKGSILQLLFKLTIDLTIKVNDELCTLVADL